MAKCTCCCMGEIVAVLYGANVQYECNVCGLRWEKKESMNNREIPRAVSPSEIKDSGQRHAFGTGAVRDMQKGKGRLDLVPPWAILRLSKHYEGGAVKYAEHNWEVGIPSSSFYNSGMRHLLKWFMGERDEDHLAAVLWNVIGLMHNEEYRKDMEDLFYAKQEATRHSEHTFTAEEESIAAVSKLRQEIKSKLRLTVTEQSQASTFGRRVRHCLSNLSSFLRKNKVLVGGSAGSDADRDAKEMPGTVHDVPS